MSEKKKIWEKPSVQIGIGVLLYFLLRGGNSDQKTKTENKPVDIKGNENEVTKGVKIQDVSLIRIDPTISVNRFFKNSEYFGKKAIDVPEDTYNWWLKLASTALGPLRLFYTGPILIKKGYSYFKDGRTATIAPKSGEYTALWNATKRFIASNPNALEVVTRLPNGEIQLTVSSAGGNKPVNQPLLT